jgi:hypothetical protein
MTSTPEYASDGTTLIEGMRQLERDGFTGQMSAQPGGLLRCYSCREDAPADEVELRALRRSEGASDPDDMVALAAVECPRCGALGTVALKYGPEAPVDEAEVLRLFDDAARAATGVPVDEGGSAA